MISLATTHVPPRAYLNVLDALRTGRLGRGKYVERLEQRAREYFDSDYALAVANGTIADIILLAALKELNPEKTEVVLPALTFIAQANAVLWAGLKPVFVDVDEDYQMDFFQAEKAITKNTLCLFPAHLLGKSAPISLFGLSVPVLEDCCEAMGGVYNDLGTVNRKLGSAGLASAFSMYPSHTITTGEGGLIITNDKNFYNVAKSIHNHGKTGPDFDFGWVGINGKMTNLQAAIGCELIETIEEVNLKRRNNVRHYNQILKTIYHASSPHCYPVIYQNKMHRDGALNALAEAGIEARKLMSCVPETGPYASRFGSDIEKYPNAQKFSQCGLFLPIHQDLKPRHIRRICHVLPKP